MRLFLAVDLPVKVKKQLDGQLENIKKEYPQFNWVSVENFHVTIHFFGETNKVEQIKKRIKDLLWDQTGFFLYSFAADVFVNHKLVVYLTFRREKRIEKLAERIKSNFRANSVSERKFVPHLTLARGPRSSKQQYFVLKKRLQSLQVDISFAVKRIILFESILDGRRPIYKKVISFKLLND
ncbi:RNA 2',3'-cyclic phosphodiesterase [Candidatus Roizmanbacteria bacterium CG11_big_fil_rev_8_21_14_0_20_35_14]|uniref:RNA 2',3'-cyclic phosphodiesterase n=3 Tax=Candidatus Roizmaniibacteriota TaxID=1752723 RepID=A0A2H0KLM9_9BACT|nr:MAG: RNA 2',3'-cyclic phosphodiesterase [Candidatus Roizmanbacteria bacterium CG11_big_fil_rev_8_21_14_0_20_35_14]